MLGVREPDIYGPGTLQDIKDLCIKTAETLGMAVDFRQSNHEGEFIEWIQAARGVFDGIIINAAGWTHSSIAIHDALKIHDCPIIEVHLSNLETREAFRHMSYITPVATAVIAGRGAQGYKIALETLSYQFRSFNA